jgi:hypothetical protein
VPFFGYGNPLQAVRPQGAAKADLRLLRPATLQSMRWTPVLVARALQATPHRLEKAVDPAIVMPS